MLVVTNWVIVRIPKIIGDALTILEEQGSKALRDSRDLAVELMLLAGLVILVRTLSRVLFFNPGRDIEHRVRSDLFGHLLTLQRPYFMQTKVGELVSIASNDTTAVRLLMGFAGLQVLNVAVAIPLHLYQMFATDAVLTAWCLAPVTIGGLVMRSTVKRFFGMIRETMALLARLSDRVLESYSGIGTIRSHAVEAAAARRFEERNQEYLRLMLRVASIRAFGMPVLGFSGLVGTGIVLWVGGNRVLAGRDAGRRPGNVHRAARLDGLDPHGPRLGARRDRSRVHFDASRRRRDADRARAARGRGGARRHRAAAPRAAQSRLHVPGRPGGGAARGSTQWSGPGRRWASSARPDRARPPSSTCSRGSRRLPPAPCSWTGATSRRWTSRRIGTCSPSCRRRRSCSRRACGKTCDWVGPIPGALGRKPGPTQVSEETDPRVVEVLESAALSDDIGALPDGLATVVGERGVMLSGGQRQRAALARALYRQRPLLLLDDVLSAVDQGTEARMVEAIRGLRRGDAAITPTTVIVSHRTSVLEHADEILVLEDGKVVERGTHAELIAAGGRVRRDPRAPGARRRRNGRG